MYGSVRFDQGKRCLDRRRERQACAPDPESVWRWSRWRRRRQYQARLCHYRQRGYALT